jgi:hypothetical protein
MFGPEFDGLGESVDGVEDAALQPLLCEKGEPSFDQVQPACGGKRPPALATIDPLISARQRMALNPMSSLSSICLSSRLLGPVHDDPGVPPWMVS